MSVHTRLNLSFDEVVEDPICLHLVADALLKSGRVELRDGMIIVDNSKRKVVFSNGVKYKDITSFFLWLLKREFGLDRFFS